MPAVGDEAERPEWIDANLYPSHQATIAGQPGIVGDYNSITDDPLYAHVFAVRIGRYVVAGGVAHHGYLPTAEARVGPLITSLREA